MTDYTPFIAAHEAGHAVACYLLGHPIDKLEAWAREGRMRHLLTEDEVPAFDHAVISLAGEAFTDSLGLVRLSDNHYDKETAAMAITEAALPRGVAPRPGAAAAAHRALKVVEDYLHELVRKDHFQSLGLALGAELRERNWMWGPDVWAFLCDRDSARGNVSDRLLCGQRSQS